jgi:hypothetical protein
LQSNRLINRFRLLILLQDGRTVQVLERFH